MNDSLRAFAQRALATLLVAIPAAYLFWEWRYSQNPVLPAFSYDGTHKLLSSDPGPAFWSYALYVFVAIACLNAATAAANWVLGKVISKTRPAKN